MRKYILLTLASLFAFIGSIKAQDSDHFHFKGIPIDGSLSKFGSSLVSQGFTKINNNTYKGKFLRNEAIVALVGDDDNMIWRVAAVMPSTDTWSILESSFNGYVDLYTEKYGTPTKLNKSFAGYTGNSASIKMSAIYDGECEYYAIWNLKQGTIEVRIVKSSTYKEGSIRIVYTDNANKEDVRKSDLDEI